MIPFSQSALLMLPLLVLLSKSATLSLPNGAAQSLASAVEASSPGFEPETPAIRTPARIGGLTTGTLTTGRLQAVKLQAAGELQGHPHSVASEPELVYRPAEAGDRSESRTRRSKGNHRVVQQEVELQDL